VWLQISAALHLTDLGEINEDEWLGFPIRAGKSREPTEASWKFRWLAPTESI